jgi:predicted RNase H-like HicB family nuclease
VKRAHVIYHFEPEGWWVDSPEYPSYTAFGASRAEVTALARDGLPFFAGEELEIIGLDAPRAVTGGAAPERMTLAIRGFSARRILRQSSDPTRQPQPTPT